MGTSQWDIQNAVVYVNSSSFSYRLKPVEWNVSKNFYSSEFGVLRRELTGSFCIHRSIIGIQLIFSGYCYVFVQGSTQIILFEKSGSENVSNKSLHELKRNRIKIVKGGSHITILPYCKSVNRTVKNTEIVSRSTLSQVAVREYNWTYRLVSVIFDHTVRYISGNLKPGMLATLSCSCIEPSNGREGS